MIHEAYGERKLAAAVMIDAITSATKYSLEELDDFEARHVPQIAARYKEARRRLQREYYEYESAKWWLRHYGEPSLKTKAKPPTDDNIMAAAVQGSSEWKKYGQAWKDRQWLKSEEGGGAWSWLAGVDHAAVVERVSDPVVNPWLAYDIREKRRKGR